TDQVRRCGRRRVSPVGLPTVCGDQRAHHLHRHVAVHGVGGILRVIGVLFPFGPRLRPRRGVADLHVRVRAGVVGGDLAGHGWPVRARGAVGAGAGDNGHLEPVAAHDAVFAAYSGADRSVSVFDDGVEGHDAPICAVVIRSAADMSSRPMRRASPGVSTRDTLTSVVPAWPSMTTAGAWPLPTRVWTAADMSSRPMRRASPGVSTRDTLTSVVPAWPSMTTAGAWPVMPSRVCTDTSSSWIV